jgi:NAD(P)-dependent dehydrogenase (short-subunit alcohol dehydrogenase family)
MSKQVSVQDKVAFVSGGNRGIGKAIVEELIAQGASKVYVGARKVSSVDELVATHGDKVVPVELEFDNDETITGAAANATDVEILINNAGVFEMGNFLNGNLLESLEKNLNVNVWGTAKLTQAFLPTLQEKESAALVTVSSVVGLANMPGGSTYSMSKAAVHSMIQGLRGELKDSNILVAGVYPGPIDTDMTKGFTIDKASPETVAQNVVQGIQEGTEDIYPDPMSEQVGAMYTEGFTYGFVIVAANSLLCFFVAAFSIIRKVGVWKTSIFDYWFFIAGIIGIILWQVFNNPDLAITFAVIADLSFGIPTIIKIYKDPESETLFPWSMAALSGLTGLFAISYISYTEIVYPVYLSIYDTVAFASIIYVQKIAKKKEKEPMRLEDIESKF